MTTYSDPTPNPVDVVVTALVPAGLELPPSNPFDIPPGPTGLASFTPHEVVTYDPEEATPEAAVEQGPRLNRAQRRSIRHTTIADVRLLGRVVRYDLAQRPKDVPTAAVYPSEVAATYGLERAAKAMRLAGELTRGEQARVQTMARNRRAALKKTGEQGSVVPRLQTSEPETPSGAEAPVEALRQPTFHAEHPDVGHDTALGA